MLIFLCIMIGSMAQAEHEHYTMLFSKTKFIHIRSIKKKSTEKVNNFNDQTKTQLGHTKTNIKSS